MEDSSIDSGFDTPTESKIPMALGFVGIVLGGIALILAMSARSSIAQINSKQNDTDKKVYEDVQQAIADARANSGEAKAYETLATDFEAFKNTVATNFENVNVQYSKLAETVASVSGRRVATAPVASSAPQPGTSVDNAAAPETGEYTIRRGDNLWNIAKSLGCTVKDVQDLNPGLDPNKLREGQTIRVPASR